ncbi:MAG: trypsin-like peptidase domain-containing protein [Planctomycetes bacterium]|nr:trypsin-like peptidase domain-containing protein [Planctomycetota bacterium]
MKFRFDTTNPSLLRFASVALGLTLCFGTVSAQATDPSARVSPIVRAIQRAEAAVVSIQGNKVVATASASGTGSKQEVNGMGTGVIIDRRGYIITNLHVVEDVGRIEVTLSDGSTAIAKLLNYDPETDLALIKIPAVKELPTIQFGTSSDLMRGETVVAIGNPFGYQNTVTQGIISALHRDIPVNGTQEYKDLIQTNADINPGNSGGPLLNLDGDVIGINVAVRVGAQGIGFAIPIDSALEVMANLVASVRREPVDHGLELTRSFESGQGKLMLRSDRPQESNSQALHACDVVEKVNGMPVQTRLDVELALLESRPGELAEISIARGESRINQSLQLKSIGSNVPEATVAKLAWEQIGIRVVPVAVSEVASINEDYRGGLKITEVRPGSPAARNRLMVGDIIVGIMEWQTVNMENLQWILASPNFKQGSASKYYVIRKRQQLMVAMTPDVQRIR